jgi:site-specific DNA-cytosine methylase
MGSDGRRYRRLSLGEIATLQGFDPVEIAAIPMSEAQRIRLLGDAVPPPMSRALVAAVDECWTWSNRTAVEVCAGIGGLADGACHAGLEHLELIDAAPESIVALRHRGRWPRSAVLRADVRSHDWSFARDRTGLLSGGTPCQPWSAGGLRGGKADPRDLLSWLPELVAIVNPEVFLFENVPGVASRENGPYLRDLIRRLASPEGTGRRYGVCLALFNAADFGVAQRRRRLFILGMRDSPAAAAHACFDRVQARATHGTNGMADTALLPWQTIANAIGHLPDPGGWRRWSAE